MIVTLYDYNAGTDNMLTIAVQAGGESRRMGRDKAWMPFLGQPLVLRIVARVAPAADEWFVVTNRPEPYARLGIPLAADIRPGRGALGGLYTALSAARHDDVAAVGCDMPFVNAALLIHQRDVLMRGGVDAVVPITDQGFEPFHAVYRRDACLEAVQAALDAGEWRATSWLDRVRVYRLSSEEARRHDPQGLAFRNANTIEEFQATETTARELEQPPSPRA